MNQIKFIMAMVFVSAYTSSWWMAATTSNELRDGVWITPFIMTFVFLIFFIGYLHIHWNDD